MQLKELQQIVNSTADAAFAADPLGSVVAWNDSAAALFGVPRAAAVGTHCGRILRGAGECGPVCGPDCPIRCAARARRPVANFDLAVETGEGRKWCNISVLLAEVAGSVLAYSIHVIRAVDIRKRLELVMRDFIVASRSPCREVQLTARERQVLSLLAKGRPTAAIARELAISSVTVSNHIQHILRKLGVHTRLEAIRAAEHSGLLD
jgi:DNA-binding CsgD family transcriptional regulator